MQNNNFKKIAVYQFWADIDWKNVILIRTFWIETLQEMLKFKKMIEKNVFNMVFKKYNAIIDYFCFVSILIYSHLRVTGSFVNFS